MPPKAEDPTDLDNGGRFSVDLTGLHGKREVAIRLNPGNAPEKVAKVDVVLPQPPPLPSESKPGVEKRPESPPPILPKAEDPSERIDKWISNPTNGSGLIAALLLVWLFVRTRRWRTMGPLLATLEVLDGKSSTHEIRQPVYRIGRNASNDLQLLDESVSRFHAEIQQNRWGSFDVVDLHSTNGTQVNEQGGPSHPLKEGDVIKLGDVCLRFHPMTGVVCWHKRLWIFLNAS